MKMMTISSFLFSKECSQFKTSYKTEFQYFIHKTELTSKLALFVGFKTRKRFNKFSQSVDI